MAVTQTKRHGNHPRLTYWLNISVLLPGAVLRLAAFDETLIEPSQSAIPDTAFQIARENHFPLTGMRSSVGMMQTGTIPVLSTTPLFLVKRTIAVQWFFSALDLLAVSYLSFAVRHTFGQRAGLTTALLYATAPRMILYARTIWYQTLVATFATISFAGLLLMNPPAQNKTPMLPLTMYTFPGLVRISLVAGEDAYEIFEARR